MPKSPKLTNIVIHVKTAGLLASQNQSQKPKSSSPYPYSMTSAIDQSIIFFNELTAGHGILFVAQEDT